MSGTLRYIWAKWAAILDGMSGLESAGTLRSQYTTFCQSLDQKKFLE